MTQVNRTFIMLDNLSIAEYRLGEGAPVILLHGWGASIDLMQPLAECLAGQGYATYTLDMPGFGQSPPPPEAWSVFDYANLIVRYLDYHSLQQVDVVGHSFGGRLGLILGAEHSERIRHMALIDSAGIRPTTPANASLRLKAYRFALNTLRKLHLNAVAENLRNWYSNRYGSSDYKALSGIMRETFVRVVNEDLLPYAARVQPATLLIWGDQDEDTPLWQAHLLEKTIPDAGLVVWEGAGHYSYLERLTETTRVLAHFFSQDT